LDGKRRLLINGFLEITASPKTFYAIFAKKPDVPP